MPSQLSMYGRFAWGLRKFLRNPISFEEAEAIVYQRMAERDENFLHVVKNGVFGNRDSPYLRLFQLAGCEYGDVETMVAAKGLEGALCVLREAGVYVTFEEFKCREPIVRGGQTVVVQPKDFDNPYLGAGYQTASSGSTGAGTRVSTDLAHLADRVPVRMVARHAQGVLAMPKGLWRGVLPDASGINAILSDIRMGNVPRKWFTPAMDSGSGKSALRFRLANCFTVNLARLHGANMPRPEPVALEDAVVIARWIADTVKQDGACFFTTSASMALRICVAALDADIDLTGAVFSAGSEPSTPAKVKQIVRTGARCVTDYYFTEVGPVGMSCGCPADCNDLHFLKDHLAMIQYPRRLPGFDIEVAHFHFTTLLPTAPKLLLNVEIDDYGTIETRACGCPMEAYGFTEHIRDLRSSRKLTGEGVTLVGSEMMSILEHVLPARFGGTALDYQLHEDEDNNGFTRLNLRVSPRVKLEHDQDAIDVVLTALQESSVAGDVAQAFWRQSNAFRVIRAEPIWSSNGKLLPLHLARQLKLPSNTE